MYVGQATVSVHDDLMTYASQDDVVSAAVTSITSWRQHRCLLQRPQYDRRRLLSAGLSDVSLA